MFIVRAKSKFERLIRVYMAVCVLVGLRLERYVCLVVKVREFLGQVIVVESSPL